MRLRNYQAKSTKEAMNLVRKELGPHALIISVEEKNGIVKVVAAQEHNTQRYPVHRPQDFDTLLHHHKTPHSVIELLKSSTLYFDGPVAERLRISLESVYTPPSLKSVVHSGKPIMLVGPPGVGKTLTLTKIAAQLTMEDKKVEIISMDQHKTGAFEQIEQLAYTLAAPLQLVESPSLLQKVIDEKESSNIILIDTPGMNPYIEEDRQRLQEMTTASNAKVVLVMPARGDHEECQELEDAFQGHNIDSMILTQLDLTTRLGHVLTRCLESAYPVIAVGQYPQVAHFLIPTKSDHFINLFTQSFKDQTRSL